ncbi:hypothetical protein V1264_008424 [Littorina saxatilis]|uniref:Uncharacterized protein n=1 Tax=Littorina saxatilis TaxID=31220 RepID=A0AAN9AT15_9CAEN
MAETVKRASISSNNQVAPAAQNNQVAPAAHNNQVAPDAHNNLVSSSATKDDEGDSAAGGEGDIDTQPCSRVYKRRVSRPFSGRRILQMIEKKNRRLSSFEFPPSDLILTAVPDIEGLQSIDMSKVPWWTSQRFLLSILCFFGFVMMFAQRVNLSIAIVSMVDNDFLDSLVMNQSALAMNQSGLVTPVVDKCPTMDEQSNLSVMYPACQALWARWAPPHERSRLIGFSYAGKLIGRIRNCVPISYVTYQDTYLTCGSRCVW